MTKEMWLELIPVGVFVGGTIGIGYLDLVIQRAIKLHRVNKRRRSKQEVYINRYIEYRKAM